MAKAKTLSQGNAEEIAEWCGGRAVVQHPAVGDGPTVTGVNVLTEEGVQRAQPGDTIISQQDGYYRISKRQESER